MPAHKIISDLVEKFSLHLDAYKSGSYNETVISRRNVPCEVCGENRSIDQAHIIPRKIGGPALADNLLFLCPTHHRLFDRFMLSRDEYVAIDWERKSTSAQHYAQMVILAAHQKFWERIESGHYQQLGQHEENSRPFVKYAIMQLLQLFKIKQTMKRSNIYSVIDPHLRDLSKKIVSFLVEEGVLRETKYGAVTLLSIVKSDFEPSDAMVLRVWQKL